MFKRLARFLLWVIIATGAIWLLRFGLRRWIDGPDPKPAAAPWTPEAPVVGTPDPETPTAVAQPAVTVRRPPTTRPISARADRGPARQSPPPREGAKKTGPSSPAAPASDPVAADPVDTDLSPSADVSRDLDTDLEPSSTEPSVSDPATEIDRDPVEGEPVTSAGRRPLKATRMPQTGETWITPDPSGEIPATHAVKAKLSSLIYHLPGGLAYARTQADRLYESAEAAEDDGFRRAKR